MIVKILFLPAGGFAEFRNAGCGSTLRPVILPSSLLKNRGEHATKSAGAQTCGAYKTAKSTTYFADEIKTDTTFGVDSTFALHKLLDAAKNTQIVELSRKTYYRAHVQSLLGRTRTYAKVLQRSRVTINYLYMWIPLSQSRFLPTGRLIKIRTGGGNLGLSPGGVHEHYPCSFKCSFSKIRHIKVSLHSSIKYLCM